LRSTEIFAWQREQTLKSQATTPANEKKFRALFEDEISTIRQKEAEKRLEIIIIELK